MSHNKPFNPFEPAHAEGKTIVPPEESLDELMSTPPPAPKDVSPEQAYSPIETVQVAREAGNGFVVDVGLVGSQYAPLVSAALNGFGPHRRLAVSELWGRWQNALNRAADVAAELGSLREDRDLLKLTLDTDRAMHRQQRGEWDKLRGRQERQLEDLGENLLAIQRERDQAMESLAPNERELLSTREALQAAEAARDDAKQQAERLEVIKGALEQALADKRRALQVAVNGNMELTQRVAELKQELHESDQAMRGAAHRASRAEAELDKLNRRIRGSQAMVVNTSHLSSEQRAQLAQDIADSKPTFTPIQPEQPLPKHLDVELPPIAKDERGNPKAVIARPPPVQGVGGGGAQPATSNPFEDAGVKGAAVPAPTQDWVFRGSGEGAEPWPKDRRPAFGRKVEVRVFRMVSIDGISRELGKTVEAVHNGHEEMLVEQRPDGPQVYGWDDVLRWRYLDVAPEDDDAVPGHAEGGEE